MALLPGPAGADASGGLWREGEGSLLPPFPREEGLGPCQQVASAQRSTVPCLPCCRLPRGWLEETQERAWLMGPGLLPISSPKSRTVGTTIDSGGHSHGVAESRTVLSLAAACGASSIRAGS